MAIEPKTAPPAFWNVDDDLGRRHGPLLERRHRGDRLEGRAGGIGAGDCPVEEGRAGVLGDQGLVLGLRERLGEEGRVEARARSHRYHLAGVHVHRDEGPRESRRGERALADGLQLGVEREAQRVPGDRVDDAELPLGAAERVDLDPRRAGASAQVAVVLVLDPILADDVAGLEAAIARLLQLLLGDLAGVAEQVGRQGPLRVAADEDPRNLDPWKLGLVLLQVVDELVRDVPLQRHGRVAIEGQLLLHRLADPFQGEAGDVREPGQLRPPLLLLGRELARVDLEGEAGAVADEHVAVAVDDVPTRRPDPHLTGAVVVGIGQVLVAGEHLQVPEAEEDHGEEGEREAAEHGDPQGEARAHLRAAVV
jgi:hypothetical protein